jgi:uncharacterized OB-fold protein
MNTSNVAQHPFSSPHVNAETAPFWQAANEGKLLFKRCDDCGKPHWYPRAHCPFCGSAATSWEQASGHGTVYSFSVTSRPDPVPYAIAYVTLDEGVKMMTRIVDCDFEHIRIGARVALVFKETQDGASVPAFALA